MHWLVFPWWGGEWGAELVQSVSGKSTGFGGRTNRKYVFDLIFLSLGFCVSKLYIRILSGMLSRSLLRGYLLGMAPLTTEDNSKYCSISCVIYRV